MIDPNAPIYVEPAKEAERLAWIKWRDRVYRGLERLNLNGGYGTKRANAIMDYVWPFPVGERTR